MALLLRGELSDSLYQKTVLKTTYEKMLFQITKHLPVAEKLLRIWPHTFGTVKKISGTWECSNLAQMNGTKHNSDTSLTRGDIKKMKLRDLLKVLESDDFIFGDGDKIIPVRLYMGETLDPFLDREVSKVRAYEGGFDIDLVTV